MGHHIRLGMYRLVGIPELSMLILFKYFFVAVTKDNLNNEVITKNLDSTISTVIDSVPLPSNMLETV